MKSCILEEIYKFSKKRTPIYGVAILIALIMYTALTSNLTPDIIAKGLGLGQWILIILISIGSDFIALEYKEDTIKTLFVRHANKLSVYLSKFIVIVCYGIILIIISFLMVIVIKSVLMGNEYGWLSTYNGHISMIGALSLNIMGAFLYILFVTSLGFFLICLTRINALVIGIGLFLGFTGSFISTALMNNLSGLILILKWNPLNMIYIVNQLGNSSYIQISHLSNIEIILGNILYAIVFFCLGFMIFKKRRV